MQLFLRPCFTVLIVMLLVSASNAQEKFREDSLISSSDLKADFRYLRLKLEKTHPGLYKHLPQPRMQHLMDSLESTLDETMSVASFYRKIAFLVASIGCEHSYANIGDGSAYKDWRVLPFQLYLSGPRPIVLVNGTRDESIHPGDEVISVNGHPIDSIRRVLHQYIPSDGFMTASKDHYLSSMNFNVSYNQFIGRDFVYELQVINEHGERITRTSGNNLTFADINRNALRNPVNKPVLDADKRGRKLRKQSFRLEWYGTAAILTVRTFSEDKQVFRKTIDGFFAGIAAKQPVDLIIDLSYNGGGEEELAAYLMSYLVDRPTRFMNTEYLIDTSDAMFALSNVPEEVRKNKYAFIDTMRGGRSEAKITEYSRELEIMQPRVNGYHGRVWLYVNGGTSSAASTFAAVAQSNSRAVIVGQETAGSFLGGGTVLGLDLRLPASGIRVHSSIVYQEFATRGRNGDRGVQPSLPYNPGYRELIGDNSEWKKLIMRHADPEKYKLLLQQPVQ